MQYLSESYVSPSQAAAIIGVSSKRIVQLCNEGRLPSTRTPLGRLIPRVAVVDYAAGRQT
jgi:excisionase family DNA binding protein